jgi:hypothetical protein
MQPDDRFAVRVDGREISKPLPQARYVFAAAQGINRKSRKQDDEAKR